jgi:glyoxylase-like metal-dependent hydrolase (beta-lactamase superfamily II)
VQLGDVRIDPVIDGVVRIAPTQAFVGSTDDQWAQHREFLADDGKLEIALGGFLLRFDDRAVLVDAGVGTLNSPPFVGGRLLESLADLGVAPADITDVVFTHLHFDHVGWATQKGQVVFERATYRCDERDWEHFVVGPDGGAARKLGPVADRMEMWSGESATILPRLDALSAPGHTPGSTVIVASSGAERALLLGDVVHCPVELIEDEWAAMGDVDPELARRTRQALATEMEGSGVLAAAAHFPGLEFGRLMRGQGRRSWVV